jgi:hypothetical protein
MEGFLILGGFALCLVGLSFVLHGPPSIITINKNTYYEGVDDEEAEETE